MSESVLKTEEKISANWESCIENGMVKAGYGLIGSAMIAQIFFRSSGAKTAITAFGAGVGAGISFMDCRLKFETKIPPMATFKMPNFGSSSPTKTEATTPSPPPPTSTDAEATEE